MEINDNIDLERALKRALQRLEPSRDFSKMRYARRSFPYWAVAAGLILLLLIPAGLVFRRAEFQRSEQRRREQARDQLVQAFRITGTKLQKTRQMVAHGLNRRNTL